MARLNYLVLWLSNYCVKECANVARD